MYKFQFISLKKFSIVIKLTRHLMGITKPNLRFLEQLSFQVLSKSYSISMSFDTFNQLFSMYNDSFIQVAIVFHPNFPSSFGSIQNERLRA